MRDTRLHHPSLLAVAAAMMLLMSSVAGQESIPNPFEALPAEATDTAAAAAAEPGVPAQPPAVQAKEEAAAEVTELDEQAPAERLVQEDAAAEQKLPPIQAGKAVRLDELLTAKYSKALVIEADGPIFGRFHWYLNNRLDSAKRTGVDLVIIRLTSPGGDLEQSLQLARRLRDIDWATTMVYVPEEAISGGAIISLGADRILMQQGALIGDAGPIRMGMDGQFQHAEEKIVSYLASAIRELATAKGRPAALAEAMVDRSLTLYTAVDRTTGEATILTEKETEDPEIQEKFELGKAVPESGQNRFLTVAADRAMQLQLCEGVFASTEAFVTSLNVEAIEFTNMNWVDRTVYLLNRPWLTAVLLIVGLVGLYFELIAPGISVAGLTACCCFGIFFWSHALGGTSGWLEVLLFVLGVLCVIFEMFVVPGFGVFGITGFGLVVLSLVMASQDFLVPNTPGEWSQLQTNSLIVLGAVLGVLLLFVAQVLLLDSIPGLNRFRLSTPEDSNLATTGQSISIAGGVSLMNAEPVISGEQGVAESDLRPSGKILINQRLIDVVTEGDYVDSGSRVEVIRVEGNHVVVRKV